MPLIGINIEEKSIQEDENGIQPSGDKAVTGGRLPGIGVGEETPYSLMVGGVYSFFKELPRTLPAAFRQENLSWSWLSSYSSRGDADPNFDFSREIEQCNVPEADVGYYGWCNSRQDVEYQKEKLRKEREDAETLKNSGIFSSLLNGTIAFALDPLNKAHVSVGSQVSALIPPSLPIVKAAAFGAGFGLSYGLAKASIQELTEYSDAIYDSMAFGIMAAGGQFVVRALKKIFKNPQATIAEGLKNYRDKGEFKLNGEDNPRLNEELAAPEDAGLGYALAAGVSPVGKAARSPFKVINMLGQMIYRTSPMSKGATLGVDVSPTAEALGEVMHADSINWLNDYRAVESEYLKASGIRPWNLIQRYRTRNKFSQEVSHYIRYGDEGLKALPEVKKGAEILISDFTKRRERAMAAGVIEGMEGDFSKYLSKEEAQLSPEEIIRRTKLGMRESVILKYFPRVYDVLKVMANREKFIDLAYKGLLADAIERRNSKLNQQVKESVEKLDREFSRKVRTALERGDKKEALRLGDERESLLKDIVAAKEEALKNYIPAEKYYREKAEKQYYHVIGDNADGAIASTSIQGLHFPGEFERTILVEDSLLEEFLVNDPVLIQQAVAKKLDAPTALAETLHEYGYKDIQAVRNRLFDEYIELERSVSGKAGKTKVKAEYQKAKRLLDEALQLQEGRLNQASKDKHPILWSLVTSLNEYNNRHLGSMVFTAFQDPAAIVAQWNLPETAGAYLRYFRDMFGVKAPYHKAQVQEITRMGAAIEQESIHLRESLESFMASPLSRFDPTGYLPLDVRLPEPVKALRRTTSVMNSIGAKLNLNPVWSDFHKRVASRLLEDKILRTVRKSVQTPEDLAFLARHRISRALGTAISEQFDRFGSSTEGIIITNFEKWEDQKAANAFRASLVSSSNNTILVPGIGDLPSMFKGLPGKFLFCYWSFIFSASNNLLGRFATGEYGLSSFCSAALTSVTLGAFGKYLRGISQGVPWDIDDPQFWKEVVLQNDLVSWGVEPLKRLSFLSQRYRERGSQGLEVAVAEEIPSLRLATQLLKAWEIFSKDTPVSEYDKQTVADLMLFYKLPIIEGLVNKLIRRDTVIRGGKLRKTRREKREESYNDT